MRYNQKWIKHWAGHWKLLNNSHLGFQYTKLLKKSLGKGLDFAMFISHRGYTVCYLDSDKYKKFGTFLATKIVSNQRQVEKWSNELIKQTDNILGVIKRLSKNKALAREDYEEFIEAFYAYGVPHRVVKIVVDSLSAEKLKKFLPSLSKARVYSEPVYEQTEKFMELLAGQIAKTLKYKKEHILYVTKDEMDNYWKTNKLPAKAELEKRYKSSVLVYENGKDELLSGGSADALENKIEEQSRVGSHLKGSTAYPGKVTGRARIIFNPEKTTDFKKGDILITGMTRPEYVPIIKMCAGFVTDAGGMLSHASISARELKKPCIVGTMSATKMFKDGDMVEVDADKGTVRRVN